MRKITIIGLGISLSIGLIFLVNFLFTPQELGAQAEVVVNRQVEVDMVDWVMDRVEEAGMNKYDAYMVIQKESGWREDICIIEPNDTISCGLWMINTIHNSRGMTNACKVDYKCATEFAIELYKERGGWSAWSVSRQLGLR